jgi:hypothetical protein
VYHFTNPKETNSANAELQIFVPDSAIYHMQFLGAPDLAELIRGTKQSWAETESKWSPGVGFGGEIDRPSDVEETQRLNAAAMASAIRRIAEVHYGYRLAWMQTAAVRFSRKANRFSAELNQQRNLAIEVGKASLEHVLSFIGGVVSAWKETRKEDDGLEKAETYDLASDVILMQRSLIEIRDALTSDVGFLEKRRALYGAYALLSELLASAEKAPVGYTSIAQVLPDIVGVLLSFKADLHGLCEEATASRRAMTGESAREAAAALLEARGTVAERDVDILAGIITRLGAVLVKANGAKITRVLGRNDAASVRNAIDLVVFGGMDAVELSRDERMIYDDVESEVIDAGREDLALLAETPLKRLDACVRLAFDIPFEQLEMILLKQRGLLGLTDEAERFDLNVLLDRENEQ